MNIELSPISSFDQVEIAALVIELTAAVNGIGLIDDAQLDLDLLSGELIANPGRFDLEEEQEFLENEEFAAHNLAKEKFSALVSSFLERRAQSLGQAYPFSLKYADGPIVELKPVEDISISCVAVVAMAVFSVLQDNNVAQITKEDKAKFSRLFEPIFELVCTLALAADNEGVVWWNGRSRSQRTFLKQLVRVRDFIGTGLVRTAEQLQANQVGVNDGGVDAFGISTVNGQVGPDATCSLLGATLQRSARRNKIVGPAQVNRLLGFFINVPHLTFAGILAIPFKSQEAEAQDCRDAQCRYLPIDAIYRNLAIIASRQPVAEAVPFLTTLRRQLVSRTRKIVKELAITVNGREYRFPYLD
ncbi:hypothetical protein FIU93_04165 [Labrenzia sp. THAF35]|uniref:hypothetical protein n=1 Tax=Labrenzia sp. THAF35 TaxID=2587854 RepID=UPI00126950E3|nr:hypothetical protein [Labrenzia sp. THAF35]QFT65960.1 hypothetical protein FIU93_04165 [Labrenzia sp. THAF35]